MERPKRLSRAGARAAAEALFAPSTQASRNAVAAPIAPPSRRPAETPKVWCCDADVFVGPKYSHTRAWRYQPSQPSCGRDKTVAERSDILAEIFGGSGAADPIRLRVALRRERRAGLSGAMSYTIERHLALASAVAQCGDRATRA